MRKFVTLIALVLILTLALASCNLNPSSNGADDTADENDSTETTTDGSTTSPGPENDPNEDLKRKLAGDWSIYLAHKEDMCLKMYWMIEYLEQFCQNPTWESLDRARTALGTLSMELSATEFPSYTVTIEQHAQLIAAGCDVSGFWEELNRLDSTRIEFLSDCSALTTDLYSNVFFTPMLDCTKEYTAYLKTAVDIELELTACYTDNLIFALNNQKLSSDYMSYLKENNPLLIKYLPEFSSELSVIYQHTNDTLDKLENSINNLNTIYGKMNVATDQLLEILNSDNSAKLNELKLKFSDKGNLLPLPTFTNFQNVSFYYYFTDESNNTQHASSGSPITFTSNRCQAILSNVTEDEYKSYILMLNDIGIKPFSTADTETERKAYYTIGDSSALIQFANNEITIIIIGADLYLTPYYYYQ